MTTPLPSMVQKIATASTKSGFIIDGDSWVARHAEDFHIGGMARNHERLFVPPRARREPEGASPLFRRGPRIVEQRGRHGCCLARWYSSAIAL
jgi:hypothetical protein